MHVIDSITSFYIGLGLALASTLLIGTGFILKKKALLRASAHGNHAGDGGLLYLCDWLWWLGLILFGVGEGANFAAYAMAPAALVTPLGGLSVLVCVVLSSKFLNERIHLTGKLGCFICLIGSTLVVLHAPKEQVVNSLEEMERKFFDLAFIVYSVAVLILALVLIAALGPRMGRKNPIIYVMISAALGSLSVMACKGLGIAIKEMITEGPAAILSSWFFWLLIGQLFIGLAIQLYYLNRALDLFNTGLITALLYVFFTAFVLIASAILFREWNSLGPLDYVELVCALLLISIGVFMMTLLKEVRVQTFNSLTEPNGDDPTSLANCTDSLHRWSNRSKRRKSNETLHEDSEQLLSNYTEADSYGCHSPRHGDDDSNGYTHPASVSMLGQSTRVDERGVMRVKSTSPLIPLHNQSQSSHCI